MRYETFLFTRIQRRDFTAFVRPGEVSNAEVSTIARAFNYINDVRPLTAAFPGLYHFPLGAYQFLLRHYDSGRKHAGREIGVIEGIAVRRDHAKDEFALALPHLIAQQGETLNIASQFADIEALEIMPSAEHEWADEIDPIQLDLDDESAAVALEFANRRADHQMLLPFNELGRALLLATLMDHRLQSPPFFAFGTNADVVSELNGSGIPLDVVGTFSTLKPGFKVRSSSGARAPAAAPAVPINAPQPAAPTLREPFPPPSTLEDTQPSKAALLEQRKYMTMKEIISEWIQKVLGRKSR